MKSSVKISAEKILREEKKTVYIMIRKYCGDLHKNVEKNEYIFTAKEQGEGQESIPVMIDNLSEKTRRGLKEKADEIQSTRRNVADVTTQNLEAYQHYFKGEEYINKIKFEKAERELQKAISLDSTFGLRMAFQTGNGADTS